MQAIHLELDGDGSMPDLLEREIIEVSEITIGLLEAGMGSGKPSVMIRADIPGENRSVVFQCSLDRLVTSAEVCQGRHEENQKRRA